MKITIEYDDKAEALNAMQGAQWYDAMYDLDQKLRSICKHGVVDNREATDHELDAYSDIREMLRELMNDYNLTFNL